MTIFVYFIELVKTLFSTAEDMQLVRAALLLLYLSGVLSGLFLVAVVRLVAFAASKVEEKKHAG